MNPGKRASLLAVLVIAVAALAAYANTLHAPLEFDDLSSIQENPSIRQLWPPWQALSPPGGWGFSVSGRPILNYSLAVNYAIGGEDVGSYHVFNLAVHILAGVTLFGLLRRTFTRPLLAEKFGAQAWPLALAIALVWTLHPLQTEAVTYIIQRAESLMGLFFLLTLYGFVRALDSSRPRWWWTFSVGACLLGVATKEIAALAPIMVFLYDRTFVSGGFREAWRRHRWQHGWLFATWLPLLWFLFSTGGDRGGTFHFSDKAMWVGHALTQFEAVTRYFWLTFWPHPQVFDYGEIPPPGPGQAILWALPVVALAGATLVALWRWPVAGFAGAWVFLILAPTSALPATLQIIVEHRMYLPLAAIVALVFGAAAGWLGTRVVTAGVAVLAVGLGVLTLQRNAVYRSGQALWEDTVAKRPKNARALNNLGLTYYNLGRINDSIPLFEESRRLDPSVANTYYNLGLALMNAGRGPEALAPFDEAVRILPYYFKASLNAGTILMKQGREEEAHRRFAQAMRYDPKPAEVEFQVGASLAGLGRWNEANEHYAKALQIDPTYVEAQANWGAALFQLHAAAEAIDHFNAALRLKPDLPDVHFNLGLALDSLGRLPEAVPHYAEAVRLKPEFVDARLNLGIALGRMGKLPESIAQLQQAVRLRPDLPAVHANLATALDQARRVPEALAEYQAALRLQPENPVAQYNVGYALLESGRGPEARSYFAAALRLEPRYTAARDMLRRLDEAAPAH